MSSKQTHAFPVLTHFYWYFHIKSGQLEKVLAELICCFINVENRAVQ